MIPFSHTWPYEQVNKELYFHECPACGAEHVLLPWKEQVLEKIRSGEKRLLVLPCCYESLKVIDADDDYILADKKLR